MWKYFLLACITVSCVAIAGCKDEEEAQACSCATYERYFSADSTEIALVPSAFSPNGDGVNDVLAVYGLEIEAINFRVKDGNNTVFQTTDLSEAWDGTINGNAPPDCKNYSYVLDVTFNSGVSKHLQGTVTLLFGTNNPGCPENIPNCTFGNTFDGTKFNDSIGGEIFPC